MALLLLFLLVVLTLAVLVIRQFQSPVGDLTVAVDRVTIANRYRPMLRLLDNSDLTFIGKTGNRKLIDRMRSQRRGIFRCYLQSMRRDHATLCAHLREMIVNSSSDCSELAVSVARLEFTFRLLLIGVNARLMLHAVGIGAVDVTQLVQSFDALREQFELFSPMQLAPSAA